MPARLITPCLIIVRFAGKPDCEEGLNVNEPSPMVWRVADVDGDVKRDFSRNGANRSL